MDARQGQAHRQEYGVPVISFSQTVLIAGIGSTFLDPIARSSELLRVKTRKAGTHWSVQQWCRGIFALPD
jgi:hypothetical protein